MSEQFTAMTRVKKPEDSNGILRFSERILLFSFGILRSLTAIIEKSCCYADFFIYLSKVTFFLYNARFSKTS